MTCCSRANLSTNGRQAARAQTDYAEGIGDSGPQTPGRHGGAAEARSAGQEALDRSRSRRPDQLAEHWHVRVPAVVAPRPFVQVTLQPLVRDGVMRASHAGLEQPEEAVDGLRMHVPVHVDAGVVVDPAVRVAALPKPLVDLVFVRVYHRAGQEELPRFRLDDRGSTIWHDLRADTPAPLDRSEYDRLSLPVSGLRVPAELGPPDAIRLARLPAYEGFVGFDVARERLRVLRHKMGPKLVEHAPCGS